MKKDVDWLEARARMAPTNLAIIDPQENKSWTYAELFERSIHLAYYMENQGVTAGDRVALLAPNHVAYIDFIFACRRLGAIFVPLNWRLAEEELTYIIQDCEPKLIGFHERFKDIVGSLPALNTLCVSNVAYDHMVGNATLMPLESESLSYAMEIPWMMIYTGGTTGKPKGVVLTNRSIYTNSINTVLSWSLSAEDITLTIMPMFHTGGLNALTLPILHAGGTVVLFSEFHADQMAKSIEDYKCTIVLLVPTMYHMLIQSEQFQQRQYRHMKVFLSGGAPCPPSVYNAFQSRNLAFKEGYGLTEAGPNNFYISPAKAKRKPGSVGKPMMYNQILLLDDEHKEVPVGEVGEIVIAGEHVFDHYWRNQKETSLALREGWLFTGDLARQDEEGDFYLLGRKKDMIISGGENVYPQEVEQILDQHLDIQDITIIGLPDPKWGELVTAIIVPVEGKEITVDDLEKFCAKRIAKYKIPKQLFTVQELPKTPVGKIDKKELVQRYSCEYSLKTECQAEKFE